MKIEFDYRNLISIVKKHIILYVAIFLIAITISITIGNLAKVEMYESSFSIELSNEPNITASEDRNTKINSILFEIETLIKSDETMEFVANSFEKSDKMGNEFDIRESISFIYNINNRRIRVVTTLPNKDKSLMLADSLKKRIESTLSYNISEVDLTYSDIKEGLSKELSNSNKYYVELGILLGVFVNIMVFFFNVINLKTREGLWKILKDI